ncbi:MAG: ADOP family duplicated permease [Bryobacteraceae bacterium]
MSWYTRIANVFRTGKLGEVLDDELAFHVAERTDELLAEGMTEREARREAMRRFGNYTAQKERTRDMDIVRALESAFADLRYGLRQLRLSPGFTTVAVLSLGLGIGANTAIFQLIDAIRLRGLPVQVPSQLVAVDTVPEFYSAGWYSARNRAFTYAQFEQIKDRQQAFSGVLAFGNQRFNLSRGGESRYAEGLYVSANYLDLLGVTPLIGRDFTAEDDKPDCSGAGAILSYSFWQREFGGDAAAIGRTINLDGYSFPVIGVTPQGFFGMEPARQFDVLIPICADNLLATDGKGRMFLRHAWWLTPIGRLKPGWSVESASAHLSDLSPGIFRETVPESYRPDAAKKYLANKLRAVSASSGVSSLRREYENPLWILLATTGLVLLIACANLANLLLARASAREREIAVRQALGASRIRLIGQLLSESMLLAVIGGILGALLAQMLSRALVTVLDAGNGQLHLGLGVDWRIFGFTAVLALITCLLFGLAPAIRATRAVPAAAMRGGRGTTGTTERNSLRRMLVVSQIALSLVLLVGALLFGRTLRNLLTAETGIHSDGVLVARIDTKLPNLQPERRRLVFQQLQERIRAQPGVVSAAPAWLPPFGGSGWNQTVEAEGKDAVGGKKLAWMNRIGPGYFKTMATPLMSGRDFEAHDDLNSPKVAIVNEVFAKDLFNGANPVGRTFRIEGDAGEADAVVEIVGLVANTKYNGLREEFRAIAFFPLNQDPDTPESVSFMIRTRGPLNNVMAAVRRHMSELNPELLVEFRVLDLDIRQSVLRERLMANLSGGFGVLAGLLSALGLYGVMSYMVARRRSEIGVRMAMGAGWRDILGLVFKEAGRLVLVGLAIGVAFSFVLTRYAESLLFGLKPNDVVTLAVACALLAVTALLATLIPARRALGLDPVVALREE